MPRVCPLTLTLVSTVLLWPREKFPAAIQQNDASPFCDFLADASRSTASEAKTG